MRMGERCSELDLAPEPLDAHRGCHLGRQNLDDDASAECPILGDEDARHTRAEQLALESVEAAQSIAEILAELCVHVDGSVRRCKNKEILSAKAMVVQNLALRKLQNAGTVDRAQRFNAAHAPLRQLTYVWPEPDGHITPAFERAAVNPLSTVMEGRSMRAPSFLVTQKLPVALLILGLGACITYQTVEVRALNPRATAPVRPPALAHLAAGPTGAFSRAVP